MQASDIKEVEMNVPQEGGSRSSRKRRSGLKRRKTRVADEEAATIVTKDSAPPAAPTPTPAPPAATSQTLPPKVVLAPAKKKLAKVMLVPKGKTVRSLGRKTFKAKKVSVTIDNTAKTQKHRKSVLAKVDGLTDDQVRAASVQARLSRRETVAKAPIGLLRQMVKDYQTMKGMLL